MNIIEKIKKWIIKSIENNYFKYCNCGCFGGNEKLSKEEIEELLRKIDEAFATNDNSNTCN